MSVTAWHMGGSMKKGARSCPKPYSIHQVEVFRTLVREGYNLSHAVRESGIPYSRAYIELREDSALAAVHRRNQKAKE